MIWSVVEKILSVLALVASLIVSTKNKQKLTDVNEQLEKDNEILKKQRTGIYTLDAARELWKNIRAKH